jgi:hypothetical protein
MAPKAPQIQKGQIQNRGAARVLNFGFLSFEFVSCFEFRISDFLEADYEFP